MLAGFSVDPGQGLVLAGFSIDPGQGLVLAGFSVDPGQGLVDPVPRNITRLQDMLVCVL